MQTATKKKKIKFFLAMQNFPNTIFVRSYSHHEMNIELHSVFLLNK